MTAADRRRAILEALSSDKFTTRANLAFEFGVSKRTIDHADFKDDEKATCDGLFIAERDYVEFKEFYDANKAENVVYLFRYQVTDFISSEATHFVPESGLGEKIGAWNSEDTNAYFMQETVNLDFDIIDVTCTKDNVETVLPVVSSPIDNIPDGTPPVHTTSDKRLSWWQILLAVLALILVIWLLLKFAPVIVLAVGKMIALPFKAVGAASKKVKERRREKKQAKAREKEDREERYRQVMAEDYPYDFLSDEEWDYIEAMSHWEDDL